MSLEKALQKVEREFNKAGHKDADGQKIVVSLAEVSEGLVQSLFYKSTDASLDDAGNLKGGVNQLSEVPASARAIIQAGVSGAKQLQVG
jgi:hypothetical protein